MRLEIEAWKTSSSLHGNEMKVVRPGVHSRPLSDRHLLDNLGARRALACHAGRTGLLLEQLPELETLICGCSVRVSEWDDWWLRVDKSYLQLPSSDRPG